MHITTEYHCEVDFSNSIALLHHMTTKEVDDIYSMKYVKACLTLTVMILKKTRKLAGGYKASRRKLPYIYIIKSL